MMIVMMRDAGWTVLVCTCAPTDSVAAVIAASEIVGTTAKVAFRSHPEVIEVDEGGEQTTVIDSYPERKMH
jgi:hypothetical protein